MPPPQTPTSNAHWLGLAGGQDHASTGAASGLRQHWTSEGIYLHVCACLHPGLWQLLGSRVFFCLFTHCEGFACHGWGGDSDSERRCRPLGCCVPCWLQAAGAASHRDPLSHWSPWASVPTKEGGSTRWSASTGDGICHTSRDRTEGCCIMKITWGGGEHQV